MDISFVSWGWQYFALHTKIILNKHNSTQFVLLISGLRDSHFNALCTRYNQKWCYALHSYNQMCLDITLQFSSSLFHFIVPQVSCNTWAIGGFPLNFSWVSLTSVQLIQQFSSHKLVGYKKAISLPTAPQPVQYMRLTWRGVWMMWLNTAAKDTNFLCAAIHIKECPQLQRLVHMHEHRWSTAILWELDLTCNI